MGMFHNIIRGVSPFTKKEAPPHLNETRQNTTRHENTKKLFRHKTTQNKTEIRKDVKLIARERAESNTNRQTDM